MEVARIHEMDPSEEMNASKGLDFYAPESRPVIASAVARAINEGVPYDLELELVTVRGDRKWVRTIRRSARQGRQDGPVLRGALQDITDRRLAEEALRQSEESYRELFEAESDAVFLVDCAAGHFLKFNSAACALYGYSREELGRLNAADLSVEPGPWAQASAAGRGSGVADPPVPCTAARAGSSFPWR